MGESLSAYQLRSAKQVPERPLFVNDDFDFMMGMSSGMGPGLAAARRSKVNDQRSAMLAKMPVVDVERLFRTAGVDRSFRVGSATFLPKKTEFFGLLFGSARARIQAVLDLAGDDGRRARYIVVSPPRAVEGDGSWTSRDGEAAASFLGESISSLVRLLEDSAAVKEADGELVQCEAGGRVHVRGAILARRSDGADLLVSQEPRVVLRCPLEALSAAPKPSLPQSQSTAGAMR